MLQDLLKLNTIHTILGINRRNQQYVRPLNPIAAKIIADNKIIAKRTLRKVGIKTPETYKLIRTKKQLQFLDWKTLPNSFVIKPNRGTGGNGIAIFYGKKRNSLEWIRPNGETMSAKDLELHIEKILDGRFSMGENKDIAIIEERIKNHADLKKYCYKGIPDIRVIVYNNIPIMAMTRLPTKQSNGAANMHAGALAAGIDMATGVTTNGVKKQKSALTDYTFAVTDFTTDLEQNLPLKGIHVPYWDEILEISIKCQKASGLGYIGVDIAIDRDNGPMVLEINARPGLAIQHANMSGLRTRLERVTGIKVKSIKHGIRISKNLFGGLVEEELETVSGKNLVNLVEKITIFHSKTTPGRKAKKQQKKEAAKAFLDTGITTSRIDESKAIQIGYGEAIKAFKSYKVPSKFDSYAEAQEYIEEHKKSLSEHPDIVRLAKISEDGKVKVKPVLNITIKIADEIKEIEAIVSTQEDMYYHVLIGRKDMKDYLIDTSNKF